MHPPSFPFPRTLRVYALLLRLYPAGYRSEYGELMLQLFRDQALDLARARQGRGAIAGFWRRTLLDFFSSLLREHIANLAQLMHTPKAQRFSLPLLLAAVLFGSAANPAWVGPGLAAAFVCLATLAILARAILELYRPRDEWLKGLAWGIVVFAALGLLMPFWVKTQVMHGSALPIHPGLPATAALLNLLIPLAKALLPRLRPAAG